MSSVTLSGSLALTKLKHVKMTAKGQSGPVEGIFIPIASNKLVLGAEKEGVTPVYMPVRVIYNSEADSYGQNGFVAKSVSTDDYKAATTDEQKAALQEFQPILGSIKNFAPNPAAQDNAGAVSNDVFAPDDDLPF